MLPNQGDRHTGLLVGGWKDRKKLREQSGEIKTSSAVVVFTAIMATFLPQAAGSLPSGTRALEPLSADARAKGERLVHAYPDQLAGVEDDMLVWKDGTRMVIDDGVEHKSFDALLIAPDLKDQFALPYTAGRPTGVPPESFDPGRFRNEAFFAKMYGDCDRGEVKEKLAVIDWLPKKRGGQLRVTTVNGIDKKLRAVSDELDKLPDSFTKYLVPSAGAYNCRNIAGMDVRSMHGYGAAIDISVSESEYWRWTKPDAGGRYTYRNRVPFEIVEVFEKYGFIWGGKWYHYDTMHFEYRPELLKSTP